MSNNGRMPSPRSPRPAVELVWASVLHVWNDGLTAALTVLLPFMASELRLGYAQAALLRTAHLTAVSAAQIPLAALTTGVGEAAVLGGGLVWFGASFVALSAAMTFAPALAWVMVAGGGAGAFHPIATNRIARTADARTRGRAVGTLNFSGDVGKFLLPAAAGGLAALAGWRQSLAILGGVAAGVGLVYLWTHRRRGGAATERDTLARASPDNPTTWWGIPRPWPFALITAIGVLDTGIRSAALTFLPFLLVARGFGRAEVGGLFALLLVGGAAGKFACGWLTDVIGERMVIIATEILMAAGIVGLLWVGGGVALPVYLVALGAVLNGTSSVLYTGVAAIVDQSRGSRGYGLFYTSTFAGSALAPVVYGLLADRGGLGAVFWGLGLLTLVIPPLALLFPRTDREG
jgi:FSR family fosmidomycin resistance protein-like MFS transporter